MTAPIGNLTPTYGGTPSGTVAQSSKNALGKDAFLKLLVAQMGHQDPDKPMDSSQMSAQLAQFSSVEQLEQINANLTAQQAGQSALMAAMNGGVAMNALGKQVTAASDAVVVGGTSAANTMQVGVGAAGGAATLHVYDANGIEVAAPKSLGMLSGGRHDLDTSAATKDLPPGTYHVKVEVTSPAGAAVDTQTYVTGRVGRVGYTASGPTFSVGDVTVDMGSIVEIRN